MEADKDILGWCKQKEEKRIIKNIMSIALNHKLIWYCVNFVHVINIARVRLTEKITSGKEKVSR